MNEQPQPSTESMRAPWIAWILACTLLPALLFLWFDANPTEMGKMTSGMPDTSFSLSALIRLALLMCQFGSSNWLAIKMGQKLKKGPGFAVPMTVAFTSASVIIGAASFVASCLALG